MTKTAGKAQANVFDPNKTEARMAEACHSAGQVAEELIGDFFAYQSAEAKALLDRMPKLCDARLDECIANIRAGAQLPCECNPKHNQWLQKLVAEAKPIQNYEPRRHHVLRYRNLVHEYIHLHHIAAVWQSGNNEAFISLLDKFHQQVTRAAGANTRMSPASVAHAPDLPEPLFAHGPSPGGFGLIVGTDGIGKGWLTLDMLLGCALARPMNIPRFQRNGKPLRVMYLSYEDDPCVLRVRLDSLCAAACVDTSQWREAEEDGRLKLFTNLDPLFTQTGYGPPVATDAFRALEATIRHEAAQLCVIDPLAAAVALQNENDNSTLNCVAVTLRHLARDSQCAIVISHHTSKAQREALEHHAARGGSALTGAARWILRVIQNAGDAANLTVSIPKNSYGPALPATYLQRLDSGVLREISEERLQIVRESVLQDVVRIIRNNPGVEVNPNAIRNNGSPGARFLCAMSCAKPRQVAEAIEKALAAGVLAIETRTRKGNGRVYSVLVPTTNALS